jgi:hypothetical protein
MTAPPDPARMILIDDARRQHAFGLMMSLNMLIEFGVAFDYTGADFSRWCKEVVLQAYGNHPARWPSERRSRL